jgi:low affinity Fe/Cu permease
MRERGRWANIRLFSQHRSGRSVASSAPNSHYTSAHVADGRFAGRVCAEVAAVRIFDRLSAAASRWAGHPLTFLAALLTVFVWGLSGPMFRFSDTWQLVINTGTTIVTFLMVFLVQATQNRDAAAIQAKLDELIRVNREARNELIGLEDRSADEIATLRGKT